MMRFLGWGIGHLNPPDFPHEANELVASDEDKELIDFGNATAMEKGHTESHEAGLEGTDGEGSASDDNHSSVDSNSDEDAEVEYEY